MKLKEFRIPLTYSFRIHHQSFTDKNWNPVLWIRNPRRRIQNSRLSWIPWITVNQKKKFSNQTAFFLKLRKFVTDQRLCINFSFSLINLASPQTSSRNVRVRNRGWWEGKREEDSLPRFPPSHHTPCSTKERQRERQPGTSQLMNQLIKTRNRSKWVWKWEKLLFWYTKKPSVSRRTGANTKWSTKHKFQGSGKM